MTLHQEFSQYDSLITELKTSNNHFKRLFDEYESLNHRIHGIEATSIFTDEELNTMRIRRTHLKDELYGILVLV
jgi:uncharacterized protein YdcH (DUF465 family)